jgi:hypothetical protein
MYAGNNVESEADLSSSFGAKAEKLELLLTAKSQQ